MEYYKFVLWDIKDSDGDWSHIVDWFSYHILEPVIRDKLGFINNRVDKEDNSVFRWPPEVQNNDFWDLLDLNEQCSLSQFRWDWVARAAPPTKHPEKNCTPVSNQSSSSEIQAARLGRNRGSGFVGTIHADDVWIATRDFDNCKAEMQCALDDTREANWLSQQLHALQYWEQLWDQRTLWCILTGDHSMFVANPDIVFHY